MANNRLQHICWKLRFQQNAEAKRSAGRYTQIPLASPCYQQYNSNMKKMTFSWDDRKDLANQRKHGISFEEAATAFADENARLKHDPDHSKDEDRFILLGFSAKLRLLVVAHAYRQDETEIRIISARKAIRKERKQYGEFL